MRKRYYNYMFNFDNIVRMDIKKEQKLKLFELDQDLLESCIDMEKEMLKGDKRLLFCGILTLASIALLYTITKTNINVITVISISVMTCLSYTLMNQVSESKAEVKILEDKLNFLKSIIELEKKKED